MSKIEVNQISSQCGSTLTIGQSGDTIQLACGATQSGFGRTGTVNWETTAITADPNPAVSGTGYFVNTTSAAITITLPTSPAAGDIVAFADYALTWDTNNLILDPGSNKINGDTTDYTVSSEGKSLTLVYTDSTQGWKVVNDGNSNAGAQASFITATGGTVTCCGDYKIHTFTGPGTFTVTCAGNPAGSNTVDYLVVAGGGGGGRINGGGGGAGGYRTNYPSSCSGTPVTVTGYPITVGGGGVGGTASPTTSSTQGNPSIFSTITSTGGGLGGNASGGAGGPGGSGGGGGYGCASGGSGNTPPVSPSQGNNGGTGSPLGGAGGGGINSIGSNGVSVNGGAGGSGLSNSITGSPVGRAGGGGGGGDAATGGSASDGGGAGSPIASTPAASGTANTGGGGGGGGGGVPGSVGGAGGSGIVIIRYKYQ